MQDVVIWIKGHSSQVDMAGLYWQGNPRQATPEKDNPLIRAGEGPGRGSSGHRLVVSIMLKDHYGLRLEISRIKVDARSTSKTERKEGRRSLGDLKDLKDTVGYSLSLNG
ncbi:hypothetical protein H113_08377 [Trichophyton rubrum MR1459]|nr:hypothetical protein H113_08377 [Trichophyton rubrum MR1459]